MLGEKTGCKSSPSSERLLHEVATPRFGGNIDALEGWFRYRQVMLTQLGYRIRMRRVALRTQFLIDWVEGGNGFRCAVLQTERHILHRDDPPMVPDEPGTHAVGLGSEERGRKNALVMIDPWPNREPVIKPPSYLEKAHWHAKFAAVVIHWTGWR